MRTIADPSSTGGDFSNCTLGVDDERNRVTLWGDTKDGRGVAGASSDAFTELALAWLHDVARLHMSTRGACDCLVCSLIGGAS